MGIVREDIEIEQLTEVNPPLAVKVQLTSRLAL